MVQAKSPPQTTAKPTGPGFGAPPVYNPFASVQRKAAPPVYKPSAPVQKLSAPAVYRPNANHWIDSKNLLQAISQPGFPLHGKSPQGRVFPLNIEPSSYAIGGILSEERQNGIFPYKTQIKQPLIQMSKMVSSSQSTSVTLLVKNGISYDGKTGHNNGHAEMDALNDYLIGHGVPLWPTKEDEDELQSAKADLAGATMSCPGKPICGRCSFVLKALGIQAATGSEFGTKSMGSTQWGVSNCVKMFLKYCGVDADDVGNQNFLR